MTADLVTDIWVEAVATVGVGAVEFTGLVGGGVVVMGWVITLTLYLLLGSMVLLCHSSWVLGLFWSWHWYFGNECWCLVVAGFGTGAWVWDQAYPLILNTSSSSA